MDLVLDARSLSPALVALLACAPLLGCRGDDGGSIFTGSGTADDLGDGDGDNETGDTGDTGEDCGYCEGLFFYPCDGTEPIDCFQQDLVCVTNQGCLPCVPGQTTCVGNSIHPCNQDGEPGEHVEDCDSAAGEVCSGGSCANACDVADDTPSNIGCQFWAADLPNERGNSGGILGFPEPAAEPWGVVLANAGQTPATIIIERNIAALGQPPNLVVIEQTSVPPGLLKTVMLPRAEIIGWTEQTMDPPGPTGTAKTNNAFRITSTAPIVVYQFNTFTNDYSNDA